jgi:hypothetical protein
MRCRGIPMPVGCEDRSQILPPAKIDLCRYAGMCFTFNSDMNGTNAFCKDLLSKEL